MTYSESAIKSKKYPLRANMEQMSIEPSFRLPKLFHEVEKSMPTKNPYRKIIKNQVDSVKPKLSQTQIQG
jgi:hypothetical protein